MPNKVASTTRQRLHWIDALKGFAIFCVVLGHCLQEYPATIHIHNQYIQAFIMPLFMMISGYLSANIVGIPPLKKRAIQLLIPFSTWAIIAPLLNYSNNYDLSSYLLSVGKTFYTPTKDYGFYGRYSLSVAFTRLPTITTQNKVATNFLSQLILSAYSVSPYLKQTSSPHIRLLDIT